LRIRPDTGDMEAQSGQTQFGRECDDWGNWFGGNNSEPMCTTRSTIITPPQPARAVAAGAEASCPSRPQRPGVPGEQTLMRFKRFPPANRSVGLQPDHLPRSLLGDDFYGNSFRVRAGDNLVHREIVSPEGRPSPAAARHEQESEFLASTDNWFRPTMVRTGPTARCGSATCTAS